MAEARAKLLWDMWKKERFEIAYSYVELLDIVRWIYEECAKREIDPEALDLFAEIPIDLKYHEAVEAIAAKYGWSAPWAPEVVEVVKVKPERVRRLEEELKKLREEKKRWTEMRDFERMRLLERVKELEGKIKAAKEGKPEPVPTPKPEPKFKVGEKAFHPTLKDVVILAQRWHEDAKEWTYVVRTRRKKEEIVFEHDLIKLPELPPVEKVPRVPRVAPPPKTLEEIARCPLDPDHHPLERFWGPIKIVVQKEVELPLKERWARREMGLPETELRWAPEDVKIPPGFIIYHDTKRDCPGYSRYYEVKNMKLHGMTYDELVERIRRFFARIARPVVPAPPVPRAPPAPRVPFLAYVPAVAPRPFEVPLEDRDAFYAWLAKAPPTKEYPGGVEMFEMSDVEQKRRLYDNWVTLIKFGR